MDILRLGEKGCNIYFVDNFLIDAGINSLELIKRFGEDIEGLIITHAHYDHIQSARIIQEEFGCKVYAHDIEIPYILRERKIEYSGFLGFLAGAIERFLKVSPPNDVKPITEIMDCFEINSYSDSDVCAIHTPGHTPGSICIKFGDSLLCGDLFRSKKGKKAGLSPKMFCSDYRAYLNSVHSILNIDFETVYPGHGDAMHRKLVEEIVKRV